MQEMKVEKKKIMMALLFLLSVGATFSKLLTAFEVDEGAMIALAVKLAEGRAMFDELWDIYQTSAILPAVLVKAFSFVTGSYEGIAIFLRCVGILVHLAISVLVYRTGRRFIEREYALFMAVIYYNFLPRGMIAPDYTNLQMWGLTVLTCSLLLVYYDGKATRKKAALLLTGGGIAYCISILAYPSLLLTFPCYVAVMYCMGDIPKRERLKNIFGLSFVCFVCAAVFFLYIFSGTTVGEFVKAFPWFLQDGSHSSVSHTQMYIREMPKLAVRIVPFLGLAAISVPIAYKTVDRERELEGWWIACTVLIISYPVFILVCHFVGRICGVFGLQARYLVAAGCGLLCFLKSRDNRKVRIVFWWLWIPSLLTYIATFSASNLGLEINASCLYGAFMGTLLMLYFCAEKEPGHSLKRGTLFLAWFVFCLSLLFYKGFVSRVFNTEPANILEERERIGQGPLKGIYVYPEEKVRDTFYREELENYIPEDGSVCILTLDAYINLYLDGQGMEPISHGTVSYNQQWVDYYELFGHEWPDTIVLDSLKVGSWENFRTKYLFGQWVDERYELYQTSVGTENTLYFLRKISEN